MIPEQEKVFKEQLQKELQATMTRGMSIGMKSVSQVIYDKIGNVNETSSKEKLLNVINVYT